jgi:hypothetical protein
MLMYRCAHRGLIAFISVAVRRTYIRHPSPLRCTGELSTIYLSALHHTHLSLSRIGPPTACCLPILSIRLHLSFIHIHSEDFLSLTCYYLRIAFWLLYTRMHESLSALFVPTRFPSMVAFRHAGLANKVRRLFSALCYENG